MTKKLDDSDLEKVDGGIDQFQENPGDLDPEERGKFRPSSGGTPGGGEYDEMQQNPPSGGPTSDA